jgi:hypothetical protein
MSRPLKCNQITDAGDELWTASGTSTTTTGTACNAFPDSLFGPTPQSVISAGTYAVTVTLMKDATLTALVQDANGCEQTYTTDIQAEDVRCFAGKSTVTKVTLCHRTGNAKTPCVTICVDADAVAEHMAHGDVQGSCPKTGCPPPATSTTTASSLIAGAFDSNTELEVKVSPNPSSRGTEFTLVTKGISSETVNLKVVDMFGKSVYQTKGAANDTYRFGSHFIPGVYIAQVMQGRLIKTVKLIKAE